MKPYVKLLLALVFCVVPSFGQLSKVVCNVTGAQTTGYVLTATDNAKGCDWQAGGGGGISEVTGTANEITVANGTTTPVVSIAATFDISGKTSTKPVKTGTAHPMTCAVGEFFFDTNSTAGLNVEICTATNTWTVIASGAGCSVTGTQGQILVVDMAGTGCEPSQVTIDNTMGVAGGIQMPQGTAPTVESNVFGFVAPTTMTTSQLLRSANAVAVAHSVMVIDAPSSNISNFTYKAIPNCVDTGGNHLNFTQATDAFSCGTSGGGGCTVVGNSGDYLIPGATSPLGFRQYGNANVASPSGGAANTTLLFRVYIPCAWTPDRISFALVGLGMAGCKLSIGIYDDAKDLIISSGVVTDVTTVQCDDSAGAKVLSAGTSPAATGLGVTRSAGFYWIASTSNETDVTIESLWFGDTGGGTVLNATSTNIGSLAGAGAQATTNGALNASFTTGSGFNPGGIAFVPVMLLSKN